MNYTYPTVVVLQAIAHNFRYGFEIMDASGLPSGSVYPILRRLERAGWIAGNWEDGANAQREKRPARRYYELTGEGAEALTEGLSRYRVVADLFTEQPATL